MGLHRWTCVTAATALFVATLTPSGAQAQERSEIAVLRLAAEGAITEAQLDELHGRLVEGLQRSGLRLADGGAMAECVDAACTGQIGAKTGAPYVVRSRVSVGQRRYAFRLELVESASGKVVAAAEEACDLCGQSEAAEIVANQAAALREKIQLLVRSNGRLRLTSTPDGAAVEIDGERAGSTPLSVELTPGHHDIRVKAPKHQVADRTLQVVGGVEERVNFELAPKGGAGGGSNRSTWAYISLGVGVAALGTGVGLIAVDERPFRRDCSGENVDPAGVCRFRLNTLAAGVTTVVLGLGLAAAGTTLLLLDRKQRKKRQVAMTFGGWQTPLVVTGRF